MNPFRTIHRDVQSVLRRDPAARNSFEVLLCYSGLHAIWMYRFTHWLWGHDFRLLARLLSQLTRNLTGIEIHPGATIGPGFFIDHGMGVVIGETAEVGADVTIYHGVTLGGTSLVHGKRHPTLGDRVVVGAGAKLLGAIEIGDDCRIGANSVVVKSVPPNSVVVGIPGRPVVRSKSHSPMDDPDFQHTVLPDTVGATLATVLERLARLEKSAGVDETAAHTPTPDAQGLYHGEDFSI
jgi:serine O-acetyltransferase